VICHYSGNDPLLPSHQEAERLLMLLPKSKCELRKFDGNGHFLFLVWHSPIQLFWMDAWIVFKFRYAPWSISSGWRKTCQISIERKRNPNMVLLSTTSRKEAL